MKPLCFEDTVYTLRNRILIGVSLVSHADPDVVLLKHVHVVPAAILATAVGVMD